MDQAFFLIIRPIPTLCATVVRVSLSCNLFVVQCQESLARCKWQLVQTAPELFRNESIKACAERVQKIRAHPMDLPINGNIWLI